MGGRVPRKYTDAVAFAWRALHGTPLPASLAAGSHSGGDGDGSDSAPPAPLDPAAMARDAARRERNRVYQREYQRRRRAASQQQQAAT